MKKKLSIILTLALTSFVTTGCDLWEYLYGPEQQTPSQQEEEKEQKPAEEEGKKDDDDEQQQEPQNPGDEEQGKEDTNFNVNFDANGGSGTMSSKKTNGSSYVVPACTFIYENHTFNNWALNSESGDLYNVGQTISNITADITLYATWTENEEQTKNYTVTFNANGGAGTMESQTTNGSSFVVPECVFTKTDHEFKCWAYESKNGTTYNPGQTIVNINKNITLYALWDQEEITPVDPNSYYSGISNSLSGATLKTALNNLIKIESAGWSYDGLWEAYKTTDVRPDGKHLWDIYSDSTDYTLNDSRINKNYSKEGDAINREHVIPQSFFTEDAPMKSDVHHVLPSDGYVNNRRNNYPHGIVNGKATYTSNDGCKLGADAKGNTVFEPMNHYKGDIARIYFYFATCYEHKIPSFKKTFAGMNKEKFPVIDEDFLDTYLQWAIDDPVSEKETVRNDAAYEGQHNRNPFIDHPEYACKIWGNVNSKTKTVCGLN